MYKRVNVKARDLPQMRLAEEFPCLKGSEMLGVNGDIIKLIADPNSVKEYISTVGKEESWEQHVEEINSEPIGDMSDLPDNIKNIIDGVTPKCVTFALDLIPSEDNIEDYNRQERIRFSCSESNTEYKYAHPVSCDTLRMWIEDDDFDFDKDDTRPTYEDKFSGNIFSIEKKLSDELPNAEVYGMGAIMGTNKYQSHGSAFIDGLCVKMKDNAEVSDTVLNWLKSKFEGTYIIKLSTGEEVTETEFNTGDYDWDDISNEYYDGEISSADEFSVGKRDGVEWVRMWWD